jgi:hypothetical protein
MYSGRNGGGERGHALCNPAVKRGCYEKHVAGDKPLHGCRIGIAKKEAVHESPRQAEKRARAAPASAPAPSARRRV